LVSNLDLISLFFQNAAPEDTFLVLLASDLQMIVEAPLASSLGSPRGYRATVKPPVADEYFVQLRYKDSFIGVRHLGILRSAGFLNCL